MYISESIKHIGVNDRKIDLFEGQYRVPDGIAYNSYIIIDEKCAVMDSVGEDFGDEWLENIGRVLGERSPDYLIVGHMEPDHSANIMKFANKYPESRVVASQKGHAMIEQFFSISLGERALVVKDGDRLPLGEHALRFFTAPMVHWPEVVMSYEEKEGALFSADAFGKFGALGTDDEWACEARRYYFGIVGKYGAQVQSVLKKLSNVEIKTICPLHGPVLSERLDYYLSLYNTWSSYEPEERGVLIAYTSIYGNTKKACEALCDELIKRGARATACDLARCDIHEAVEDAFRYSTLVLASPTYNGDVFPYMRTFIEALTERNYQKRTVAFIENGSWAPVATKVMRAMLEGARDIRYTEGGVRILSAPNDKTKSEISSLADEIISLL